MREIKVKDVALVVENMLIDACQNIPENVLTSLKLAKENDIVPVVSHRSGETTDDTISHLAVGFSSPLIKTGAIGGERIAKLNELIRIEEELSNSKMGTFK